MGEVRGEGAQEEGGIARTTGILRSWESIGSTIAYAVGAVGVSNSNQMVLGFVLWGVTVPFTLWAIYGDWTPVTGDKDVAVRSGEGGEDSSADTSGEDVEGQTVVVSGLQKL